nr:hypothetical protein [Tanacetum cinerariifolium]
MGCSVFALFDGKETRSIVSCVDLIQERSYFDLYCFLIEELLKDDAQALADWAVLFYRHNEVACLMLGTISPKLYQQFEHNSPLEMITELQKMYGKPSGVELQELVYDTGCGTYICNTKQGLRGEKKLKCGSLYLYVGNGVRTEVEAIRSFDLVLPNGLIIILDNCHYAPSITRGVVSVSRLVDNGFTQCFTNFELSISINNMLYFNAITVNGIYEIDMCGSTLPIVNSMYSINNKRTKSNLDSTYLWHCRLAHINKKRIKKSQHDGLLKSTDNEPFDQCVSCISGKMTRKPFSHKTKKVKDVLGLIHTNVCGPLRHVSKKGASYFITFTDDYSRYGYVYLLKHKHEVFETFKVFKSEVENQLGKTVKAIRSDRDGEYISQEFKDYLKACGIVQQLTLPYTPQHNGVFERRNRYPKETMGYCFYYPHENKTVGYVDFLEKDFILQNESGRIVELEDEDILPFENTSEHPIEEESLASIVSQEEDVITVRRSVRTHKAPDRLCLNVEIDPDRLCFNVNYKATLSGPEFEKWLVDMNAEMQSMYDNKIWRLVVLPPNAKVVKSKWIYKKKTGMDGKVHIYKARLVAKGCTQTYGVDYEKTFSPVADIRDIRILIAIAAYYDYEICKSQCATTSAEMKCMQNVPFASAVGSIMYAVRCTRPDVAFAQNITSRFQQNFDKAHWTAVKNFLKYLRNTKDTFLVYGVNPEAEL